MVQSKFEYFARGVCFLEDEVTVLIYATDSAVQQTRKHFMLNFLVMGKQPLVQVAMTGSSTRLQEQLFSTKSEWRSHAYPSRNHSVFVMHNIYPIRGDLSSLKAYLSIRFPGKHVPDFVPVPLKHLVHLLPESFFLQCVQPASIDRGFTRSIGMKSGKGSPSQEGSDNQRAT